MNLGSWRIFRALKRNDRDEEVRRLRGELAHAVINNDRRAKELREVLSGALQLREGMKHEADR